MTFKSLLATPLRQVLRATATLRERARRLHAHAALDAQLHHRLPTSVVILGPAEVRGTGNIVCYENLLLYPDLYLETQGAAAITLGAAAVLSRGVHLVAMAGISVGEGAMIGEYTSIRDANHARAAGIPMRDAGHTARPIHIGREAWIGRGCAILAGVTIGEGATVGANSVVTRDVPPGVIVAGTPARPLPKPSP